MVVEKEADFTSTFTRTRNTWTSECIQSPGLYKIPHAISVSNYQHYTREWAEVLQQLAVDRYCYMSTVDNPKDDEIRSKPTRSKCIHRWKKYDKHGNPKRQKLRIVLRGFYEIEDDTGGVAPICSYETRSSTSTC